VVTQWVVRTGYGTERVFESEEAALKVAVTEAREDSPVDVYYPDDSVFTMFRRGLRWHIFVGREA
jgi:hypothetical protein